LAIIHATQGLAPLPGLQTGDQDGLISHQPQAGIDWPVLQHPVAGIALLPGEKKIFWLNRTELMASSGMCESAFLVIFYDGFAAARIVPALAEKPMLP